MALHIVAGRSAELICRKYLIARGLKHLESNYRCRYGELDLIMTDREILVFAEVRYRKRSDFGTPAETVNGPKQRRLARTALHFLQRHPDFFERPTRFDVLTVKGNLDQSNVVWLQDAFTIDDLWS